MNKIFQALLISIMLFACFVNEIDAQWKKTNGPYGSEIISLAISGGNILAGGNGLQLSTDNGASWNPVVNGIPASVTINSFAQKGNYVFAGTFDKGVFRSTDHGISWTPVNNGLTAENGYISSLIFNDTTLFATSMQGIFRSTDYGDSWTVDTVGMNGKFPTCLAANGKCIFVGNYGEYNFDNGVWLSTNNGENWVPVIIQLNFYAARKVTALGISGTNVLSGTDGGGMFLSSDYGSNWVHISNGLPAYSKINFITANENKIYIGTDSGFFVSVNNGANWSPVKGEMEYTGANALAMSDSCIFAGTNTGVFLSINNGLSWAAANKGLENVSCFSSFTTKGKNIFAGTTCGVFLSTDTGTNWTPINHGLTNLDVFSLAVIGETVFAGTNTGLFESNNDGTTWTAVDSISGPVRSLAANDSLLFAGGTDSLKVLSYSKVIGDWKVIKSILPQGVIALSVRGDTIAAGTSVNVYISLDNANTWSVIKRLTSSYFIISSIAVCNRNVYIGIDHGGIYMSPIVDTNWMYVESHYKNPMDSSQMYNIQALTVNGENVFAGTVTHGVFQTSNGGIDWHPVNSGQPNLKANSLCAFEGYLFAGSNGSGVWRRPLSEMSSIISSHLPAINHTNGHFNVLSPHQGHSSAILEFSLTCSIRVTFTLYDLSGKEVTVLSNKLFSTGTHRLNVNTQGLCNGVYMVKMHYGNQTNTELLSIFR